MVNRHKHFYVIAVVSNPVRYDSRYRLYKEFERHMAASGVQLVTVEMAFADRSFKVTQAGNPFHVQVRNGQGHELWHKENMINLGIEHLYKLDANWYAAAWIDADITFTRMQPYENGMAAWANEALNELQHHQVIQLWSHAFDLGPRSEVINEAGPAKSFCYQYKRSLRTPDNKRYGYWHTGYAWAARREAFELLNNFNGGPLLDFAPLGSADFYMGWAMLGELEGHLYQDVASAHHRKIGFQKSYIDRLLGWAERARLLKQNIGCVEGAIYHSWHGRKSQRFYNSRENILINNLFSPDTDLRRDHNGILQLVVGNQRQYRLRDQMRAYFSARNEDSVDVD